MTHNNEIPLDNIDERPRHQRIVVAAEQWWWKAVKSRAAGDVSLGSKQDTTLI